MGAVELVGVAASLSFLAGWRLYACVAAAGLAMRFGLLDLPQQVHALDALANPWVIGVAAIPVLTHLWMIPIYIKHGYWLWRLDAAFLLVLAVMTAIAFGLR